MSYDSEKKVNRGMLLEKECAQKFINAGWIIEQEQPIHISPDFLFRPDFSMRTKNGYKGIVEVKALDTLLLDKGRVLNAIKRLLSLKPDFLIVTNGITYDVYLFGEFFGRLSLVPTQEDIELIISDYLRDNK